MKALSIVLFVASFAGAGLAGYAQESSGDLSTNPFTRPAFVMRLESAGATPLAAEPISLELRATLYSGDQLLANIGGEILAVGDTHADYRVLSIEDGRVVLLRDGERLELFLFEE